MKNDDYVVFVPYGSRLGFHQNSIASTMTNIDYKFPQCVCYCVDCRNGCINKELSITLQAKNTGGFSVNCTPPILVVNNE